MVKEAEQEVGATAESCEATIGLLADLRLGLRCRTFHPILDVPVTAFLGVQLWSIRRQPLHVDLGMFGQVRLDNLGPMGLQSIPDNDLRSTNLATEVLQMR